MKLERDALIVFNGFLRLPTRQKMDIVNAVNEYFDSNDRDPLRKGYEDEMAEIRASADAPDCKCCGGKLSPPI